MGPTGSPTLESAAELCGKAMNGGEGCLGKQLLLQNFPGHTQE
jgi:hypothetical protein